MFKCRVTCVVLAVISLAGLGLSLYVPRTPNIPVCYFFACTCMAALVGNAVVSVLELWQAKKEMEKRLRDEKRRAADACRNGKRENG